jgi:copper transport protein
MAVTIWFTEEVQTDESWIHVLASDGTRVDTDDSAYVGDNDAALKVSLRPNLAAGTYTVSWQSLSYDGDGVAGSFSFGVGAAASDETDERELNDEGTDDSM